MTPDQLKKRITVPRLVRICGISRQAIHSWKRIPAEHCLAIEQDTGISRHKLRPDVYGKAPATVAA